MQCFYLLNKFLPEPLVIGIEFCSGSIETRTIHSHGLLPNLIHFRSDFGFVTDDLDNTILAKNAGAYYIYIIKATVTGRLNFYYGGVGETRTLAPVARSTSLAGKPLHQLGYYSSSCERYIS